MTTIDIYDLSDAMYATLEALLSIDESGDFDPRGLSIVSLEPATATGRKLPEPHDDMMEYQCSAAIETPLGWVPVWITYLFTKEEWASDIEDEGALPWDPSHYGPARLRG